MPDWIWSDYSTEDSSPSFVLFLSERSRQLILAALKNMDSRHSWQDEGDLSWDETDEALGNAYNELMVENMPDFTPVGTVVAFFGVEADIPDKWLLCDGSSYSDDDYPELYDIMPSTYKGGGNFQVPNFVSRTLFGAINPTADIGALGGENDVTLTTAQIPSHNHVQNSRGGAAGAVLTTSGYLASVATPVSTTTTSTANSGGGASHNNIPANINVNFIIKALP